MQAASGREIAYRFGPRRKGDIAVCYADCAKAKDLLGWAARRTIADMCAGESLSSPIQFNCDVIDVMHGGLVSFLSQTRGGGNPTIPMDLPSEAKDSSSSSSSSFSSRRRYLFHMFRK
jgi:hypothetical protein